MQGETDSANPGSLTDPGSEVGAPTDHNDVYLTDVGRAETHVHLSHSVEVHFHKGRLVTAETWTKWSGARTAELWQAIALLCFIDPDGWTLERMRKVCSCRIRLELALDWAADVLIDPIVVDPEEKARSLVRLDYVRRWAIVYLLPIPVMFPEGGPPIDMRLLNGPIEALARPMVATAPAVVKSSPTSADATSTGRGQPRKKSMTSEYIRASELLEMVPFSRATLWRWVRGGEFPKPVPISPGVTAWRRVEVEGWLKEKGLAARKDGGKKPRTR